MSGAASVGPNGAQRGAVAIVFANLKGNLGDFAILHAMLAEAGRAFPERALHVYSHPLHGVDAARMAAFRERASAFDYRGPTHGAPLGRLAMTALKLRLAPGGLAAAIRRRAAAWADRFAGFASYETVLVAGGEQWSGRQLGGLMFATLGAIRRQGVEVAAFPFSVKPSLFRLHSPSRLASLFGALTRPLVTRDEASAVLLARAGVPAETGVDSVFALADEAATVPPAADRDPDRVLLAATGRADEVVAAAGRLLAAGLKVEALSTCVEEDAETLAALRDRLGVVGHAPLTWQEVVAEFKASRLVVTNRLHGVILGVLADAPLLPVANRTKVRSFVTGAGLDRHADDFAALGGALAQAALAGRDDTLARMRAYHRR
ncbi:polysaccharide pyruvyl transferase family protein, partial [Methylopila musalis]